MMTEISLFAQDLRFSQFYANRLYLNPAFAGSENCPFAMAQYRNQWPGFDGAFVSYSASYDEYLDLLQGGIGLMAISDDLAGGAFNSTSFHAQYSYHFQASRKVSVQAGLEFSRVQRKMDPSGFVFPAMIDRVTGEIIGAGEAVAVSTSGFFDFSAGTIAYFRDYYIGFAVHHLTVPDQSFSGSGFSSLQRKYTFHAGTSIPIGTGRPVRGLLRLGEVKFSPNILYQHQGHSKQLNFGFYLSYQWLETGIWVNQNLSFDYQSYILLAGYVHPAFRLAYSYDMYLGFSGNVYPGTGAHEVSLSVPLPCRAERKRIRAVKCPSF
jgi:type IX secretion system PorP/SprF family membrane protein